MTRTDFSLFADALRAFIAPVTQKKVAALLGCDRTTVVKYASGERLPDPAIVKQLQLFLDRPEELKESLRSAWIECFRSAHAKKRTPLLVKYGLKEPVTDAQLLSLLS